MKVRDGAPILLLVFAMIIGETFFRASWYIIMATLGIGGIIFCGVYDRLTEKGRL